MGPFLYPKIVIKSLVMSVEFVLRISLPMEYKLIKCSIWIKQS